MARAGSLGMGLTVVLLSARGGWPVRRPGTGAPSHEVPCPPRVSCARVPGDLARPRSRHHSCGTAPGWTGLRWLAGSAGNGTAFCRPARTLMLRMSESLSESASRRRTFAIISHPDAGKTTLTEKFLLYGGAVQEAGQVKARGERRRARSDWMELEQKRGISISSAALQFPYGGDVLNLLDTPGHRDFSEDTYRGLAAAEAAVMVLAAAKGIEAQTLKLFEVCRTRNVPLLTFLNKWDRPGRDALELLDEIEARLDLQPVPVTWPAGIAGDFRGLIDRRTDRY